MDQTQLQIPQLLLGQVCLLHVHCIRFTVERLESDFAVRVRRSVLPAYGTLWRACRLRPRLRRGEERQGRTRVGRLRGQARVQIEPWPLLRKQAERKVEASRKYDEKRYEGRLNAATLRSGWQEGALR